MSSLKYLTFSVEKHHFDTGVALNCKNCPVSLAIKERWEKRWGEAVQVSVSPFTIVVTPEKTNSYKWVCRVAQNDHHPMGLMPVGILRLVSNIDQHRYKYDLPPYGITFSITLKKILYETV